LQTANTGIDMRHVLVFDVPPSATGVFGQKEVDFFRESTRRVGALPGVDAVSVGATVPWRDHGMPRMQFTVEGYTRADGEENPYARMRIVGPRFFAVLGVPILAGRDFTDEDRRGGEPVVVVSQSFAQRLFPNGDAVNRQLSWTDPIAKLFGLQKPCRIVGVVADMDDENFVRTPEPTVYQPVQQIGFAGRLFVRAAGEPYALVPAVTRVIREISSEQPVERAATLEDVRAQVLSPERLNAFVFSTFAGIALLIAVVGVAGVLAFSVSARIREFGVRLAVGSAPRHILARVLSEGVRIAAIGIAAGAVGGYTLAWVAAKSFGQVQLPGAKGAVEEHAHLQVAPPRPHEEVEGVAREHDRSTRRVDPLVAESDGSLAQPLPRVAQVIGQILGQRRLGRRPTVVRCAFLDPLVAMVALASGHPLIVVFRHS